MADSLSVALLKNHLVTQSKIIGTSPQIPQVQHYVQAFHC